MHLLRLLLKSVPSISKVLSSRLLPADLFLQNISFGASLSCLTLSPLSRGESV